MVHIMSDITAIERAVHTMEAFMASLGATPQVVTVAAITAAAMALITHLYACYVERKVTKKGV